MDTVKMKPIWYFVGLLLLAMGAVLCFSGIYYFYNPPAWHPILAELHPNIWWGAFMAIGGVIFILANRNRRV